MPDVGAHLGAAPGPSAGAAVAIVCICPYFGRVDSFIFTGAVSPTVKFAVLTGARPGCRIAGSDLDDGDGPRLAALSLVKASAR
jgi:hypothetical protein